MAPPHTPRRPAPPRRAAVRGAALPLGDDDPRILPDDVYGPVLASFPSERLRPLLVALALVVTVGTLLQVTLVRNGAWWGGPLAAVLMGVLVLVLGWRTLNLWNREVILFVRGFHYREGGGFVPFAYHEVAAVRVQAEQLAYFGGLWRRRVVRTHVRTFAGDSFALNNTYRRAAQLADLLSAQVAAALTPRLHDAWDAGTPWPFSDDLALGDDGLHAPPQPIPLPWAALAAWRAVGGQLLLYALDDSTTPWAAVPLAALDNLPLLRALLLARGDLAALPTSASACTTPAPISQGA